MNPIVVTLAELFPRLRSPERLTELAFFLTLSVGLWLLVHTALVVVVSRGRTVIVRRRRVGRGGRSSTVAGNARADAVAAAALLPIPWIWVRVASAVIGVGLVALVFGALYPESAVLGLAGFFVPGLVRGLVQSRRRDLQLAAIWGFLTQLDTMLQIKPTLTQALHSIAQSGLGDPVTRQLRAHLKTRSHLGHLPVIKALAADFPEPELVDLVRYIEVNQSDAVVDPEAIERVTDEIEQRLVTRAEHAVESAPSTLILPMLVALFLPVLALVILPTVQSFLAALNLVPASGLSR